MDCWASIRNSTVHPSDIDPAEIGELYDRYQSALTLFNELVILIIGYTSEYTDYSAPGWPRRKFDTTFQESPNVPQETTVEPGDSVEPTPSPTEACPQAARERASLATPEQKVSIATTATEAPHE